VRFKPSPKDNTDPGDGLKLGSGSRGRAPYIKPLMSKGIGLDSVPPEMASPEMLRWLAAELMFLPPGMGLGR